MNKTKDIEIELKVTSEEEACSLAKEIGCELDIYYKKGGTYIDEYEDGARVMASFRKVPYGFWGRVNNLK